MCLVAQHAACLAHLPKKPASSRTAEHGLQQLWWPFTQHQGLCAADVTIMEGRWGEYFQTVPIDSSGDHASHSTKGAMASNVSNASDASDASASWFGGSVVPMYDACGSWWTQGGGADAHAHLARQVGFAAGRYLHMMMPENVNPPVLEVSARLLEGPGAMVDFFCCCVAVAMASRHAPVHTLAVACTGCTSCWSSTLECSMHMPMSTTHTPSTTCAAPITAASLQVDRGRPRYFSATMDPPPWRWR